MMLQFIYVLSYTSIMMTCTRKYQASKLIQCSLYGYIRVDPIALTIIDTPEHQRLRYIKQLGIAYLIFPSATHSRFEHSLGVYHLADKMITKLRQQWANHLYMIPELSDKPITINDNIVTCVKIAALCHDIGHGPFSHIFDNIVLANIKHINRDHEVRSCLIIEKLCKTYLDLTDAEISFIKHLINPTAENTGAIYQIVSNSLNGIDVDKFDYLARDAKTIGIATGFDPRRLIDEFMLDENGNIAYPKHCSTTVYELFYSRYMMHKKVYQHKTIKIIEIMLKDIMLLIDDIFKISESIYDMTQFCKWTETKILSLVEYYADNIDSFNMTDKNREKLLRANTIWTNIKNRDLYTIIAEFDDSSDVVSQINDYMSDTIKSNSHMTPSDLVIIKTEYGLVNENKPDPFNNIWFYNSIENPVTFKLKRTYVSKLASNNIMEKNWCVISKIPSKL